MPLQPAIPAPLAEWFSAPLRRGSLTLLTSVLGASAHWLVLRHVFAALQCSAPSSSPSEEEGRDDGAAVVLVSWLSGRQAWVEGFRKLGVDASRVTVVDGLQLQGEKPTTSMGGLEEVGREIERAIALAAAAAELERVVLVLEGLDFLVAATEIEGVQIENWALGMVLGFRERVHATVVSLAADLPLMQAQTTPLEVRHAAYVTGIMYQAGVIMSVRELDTGVARDVSGVLHVCRGPAGGEDEGEEEGQERIEEKEALYYVAGDGGVKIIEYPYGDITGATLKDPLSLQNAGGLANRDKRAHRKLTTCLVHTVPIAELKNEFRRVPRHSASAIIRHTLYADDAVRRRSLHIQKHTCSSCGYPAAKIRQYNWGMKAKRRKTTGTGRMRHMKEVPRKFKNGFRTGAPKGARGPVKT
ncbi:MAG: hypothetical protein LQ351_006884 [Letrouitia transgressa]|nr:MAG: hypothetical protein LQ351_006884 [Letrouitia transgressa]